MVKDARSEAKIPEVKIPAWTILSGLGAMARPEICTLLAILENASLLRIVQDLASDLKNMVWPTEKPSEYRAFQKRTEEKSQRLAASAASDAVLRARLWEAVQDAFDLDPVLPFSTRSANVCCKSVAQAGADIVGDNLENPPGEMGFISKFKRVWTRALRSRGADRHDFSRIVGLQATRLVAEAAKQGKLDAEAKAALAEAIRNRLDRLPSELSDETTQAALREGDASALLLLASGTSLAGVAIAVELAGFSAYILAAQASAIIPLLGAKTAVSALFVLSNPLFFVPALMGGGALASRHFKRSIRRRLAANLTTLMALRGVAAGKEGLRVCLDGFKSMLSEGHHGDGLRDSAAYARKYAVVSEVLRRSPPATPGRPTGGLSRPLDGAEAAPSSEPRFASDRDPGSEAIAVGVLTLGDVLYDAAAIDPSVVKAADFSRLEDLGDIFTFGAFADRIRALTGRALTGAESNLRGYVAEQIVAARLVERGHLVSLPEASNNPGYDLLVDGSPFQVKCLLDMDGVEEHFDRYPDTPVFANSDLAQHIKASAAAWSDKVYFVEGYDYETADRIMDASLAAGASLDDLDAPAFAVAASAAKHIHRWWRGVVSLSDLPFEVAVDGAVKGGLAISGGFAGYGLGVLLFGPAGAVVFSGVGGVGALFASGEVRRRLDGLLAKGWRDNVAEAQARFGPALRNALTAKLEIARSKIAALEGEAGEEVQWIRRKLWDEAVAISECVHALDAESGREDPVQSARRNLKLMYDGGVHPWAVAKELKDLLSVFEDKPKLSQFFVDALARGKIR